MWVQQVTGECFYLHGLSVWQRQSFGSSTVQRLHHHLQRNTLFRSAGRRTERRGQKVRECVLPGMSCRSCGWCGGRCRGSRRAAVETWRDKTHSTGWAFYFENNTGGITFSFCLHLHGSFIFMWCIVKISKCTYISVKHEERHFIHTLYSICP